MATMIPDGVDEFKTEGERRFYRFLESAAKPDGKFTIWYLPDIEGREPDFILFGEDTGLLVIEVKDWALEQIREANPRNFILRMGRDRRDVKNPMFQAREYYESLMHRMRADRRLLSKDSTHYGKPKVPVDYGVAFPNINREPYCRTGLKDVINPRRIFFWDDIRTDSDLCADDTGECFRKTLAEMFPPRFRFNLTAAEYSHLKQLLFPTVRIEQPARDTCSYIDPTQRSTVLDDRQEAIARRSSPVRQIVSGPSGSGKTLILAHKAVFLKHYAPKTSILFLCWNIALVHYIKRLLTDKGIGLGPGGVEVHHFFELCSKILGEEVAYEKEDGEYYRLVCEEALDRLHKGGGLRYDAVLVDEGQDFTDEMFAVVEALSGPGKPNLTVALDESQNIHVRPLEWKDRLMAAGARVDELATSYRNTVEIRRFAAAFMGMSDDLHGDAGVYCETHGPKPELVRLADRAQLPAYIADTARAFHERREYPLSEMAVLYTRRRLSEEDQALFPEQVAAAVESRGLLAGWFSEDYRSKHSYDITTDRIAVSSIQSAKGLDYACVFLAGPDYLPTDPASEDRVRKLILTAITRARHRLIIPYVQENRIIEELLGC